MRLVPYIQRSMFYSQIEASVNNEPLNPLLNTNVTGYILKLHTVITTFFFIHRVNSSLVWCNTTRVESIRSGVVFLFYLEIHWSSFTKILTNPLLCCLFARLFTVVSEGESPKSSWVFKVVYGETFFPFRGDKLLLSLNRSGD